MVATRPSSRLSSASARIARLAGVLLIAALISTMEAAGRKSASSMGLDPAPKTVRSPLARGQALAGRPECDHTPEERCVTTFFRRRPLRPHLIFERREPQRVVALPASQRPAVRAHIWRAKAAWGAEI